MVVLAWLGLSLAGLVSADVKDQVLAKGDFPMRSFTEKLDSVWEFPPEMNLLGDIELMQLGVQTEVEAAPAVNQPLECECEKVKCNCVKRCDCKLPGAPVSFLQTQESLIPLDDEGFSLLQTDESVEGVNQELDCDCDKVKCNCIKHCECAVKASAGGQAPPGAALAANIQMSASMNASEFQLDDAASDMEGIRLSNAPQLKAQPANTKQNKRHSASKHDDESADDSSSR